MSKLAALPFVAMTLLGMFIAFLGGWETVALLTGKVRTISETTASAFAAVGLGWKVVILLVAGVVIGALLVHFTGWAALPGTKV